MFWNSPRNPTSSATQRGELRDEALRRDTAERQRRERVDQRLEALDADIETARQNIGRQISALAHERRLPMAHGEMRQRVFGAIERVAMFQRKLATADPKFDPASDRYNALEFVDVNFLVLCGEMVLGAAVNNAGPQRQEPARPTLTEAPQPIDRTAVVRAIVRAGAKRRAEPPPADSDIVIDLEAYQRKIK